MCEIKLNNFRIIKEMAEEVLISGIQQVGIGVTDAGRSFEWYNRHLGLDVPVFDDIARAELMIKYTLGNVRERRAILAMNMAGGGGAEIWESKKPLPIAPESEPVIGDIGIFCLKFKSGDVAAFAKKNNLETFVSPEGKTGCWIQDNFKNQLQVVPDNSWFKTNNEKRGGVLGVIIGVTDMDNALGFYKNVLGIGEVVYDKSGEFSDFKMLSSGEGTFRRVLLRKINEGVGAFSKLFGNIEIELVQALDRKPTVIFEGRSWGDLGFIHLCFDTLNMEGLKAKCQKNGFPFEVDSGNTFDMGDAGGRFSYIEDPDGTLIEFVETHKVPVMKKLGLYINLKKRGMYKTLPDWMISTLGWGRVKL